MIFEIYGVMMELLVCEEGLGIYRVSWQLKYGNKTNKAMQQKEKTGFYFSKFDST